MKRKATKLLALVLACLLVISMVGCGAKGGETKPADDTKPSGDATPSGSDSGKSDSGKSDSKDTSGEPKVLRIAVNGDSGTLSPAHTTNATRPVIGMIHQPLWTLDHDGNPIFLLCEEVERVSDTEVILHLRQNVKFSNGNPFTASDVLFSMKMYRDLGGLAAPNVQTVDIDNTTIVDDNTIDLKLLAPTIIFWSSLQGMYVYDEESYSDDGASTNPIGTGPYKLKEYMPGSSITLIRNDDYWGEAPDYDILEASVIAEDAQRVNALETGLVDLTTIQTSDYEYVSGLKGITTYAYYTGSYQIMNLNFGPNGAFYHNKDARKAVCLATNNQALLNTVYLGHGYVMHAAVPDYMVDYEDRYNDLDETYSLNYDVERAKELAESSGLTQKTLKLVTNGTATSIQMTEMLQNMLKEIGVNSEIFNYDNSTAISMLYDLESDWDIQVAAGASPNRRVGDLLVNSVRYRPDLTMEGAFDNSAKYLEEAPLCLSLQDEKELSDMLYEKLKIYEDEVLSYGLFDVEYYLGYSENIDPDSIHMTFAGSIPNLYDLKVN